MELFRLLGTIAIDNQKAINALNDTSVEGQKAESKLSKAFGKIGSAAKKVGKVVAAGTAVAGAAIVKIACRRGATMPWSSPLQAACGAT